MPRSITGTPQRRAAALLIAPATALALLSGCSAGKITQTDSMVPPVPGTNVDSKDGKISLRNVMVKYSGSTGYAAGSVAPLIAFVVNNDTAGAVTLRGVTAAESAGGAPLGTVVLAGGVADIGANPPPGAPGASTAPSAPASGSPSVAPSTGVVPSGSAVPAGSTAPSAPPAQPAGPAINLRIPANSLARLAPEYGAYLAITGLTKPLAPGGEAILTFTFDTGDPIDAPAPFEVPLSAPPRATPAHNEGEE